jgi:hypothetical protein
MEKERRAPGEKHFVSVTSRGSASLKDGRKKLEIQDPENVGYCPHSATN